MTTNVSMVVRNHRQGHRHSEAGGTGKKI